MTNNQRNKAIYMFDGKDMDESIRKMFPFKDDYDGHTYYSWNSIHGMWGKIMEYYKYHKEDDIAEIYIRSWKRKAWKCDSTEAFKLLSDFCLDYWTEKGIKF